MKSLVLRVSFAIVTIVGITPIAEADMLTHGRFLRKPADSSIVHSYGSDSPTAFDHELFCDGMAIGGIKFDYDTYLSKPGGTAGGGGALSGGFYINPAVVVRPGYSLGWIQTVTATISGVNDWGVANNVEFPDATPATPVYPFASTAATPPNPPGVPTLGYQDFPNRFFAGGVQSWLAELGLACIQNIPGADGFREVHVISTFLWGFNVTTGPNQITPYVPSFLGDPTQSYLDTLNEFYDGMSPTNVETEKFRFDDNCDCFVAAVPEPTSMALLGLASISGLGIRLRQRRRQLSKDVGAAV